MNKKELFREFKNLQKSLSDENIPNIIKSIDLFSPILTNIKDNSNDLLSDNNAGTTKRRQINDIVKNIIQKEKSIQFRKIVVEASKLEEDLKMIKQKLNEDSNSYKEFFIDIEEKLEGFLNSYEVHTRGYTISTCLSLSIWSSELQTSIRSTEQILEGILKVNIIQNADEGVCKIDLYLSNVKSLKEFAQKLDALSEIYSELLTLYGLSESDNPLVIDHLENGSLWLKVGGNPITTAVLTAVLSYATMYYHSNFTTSGKLQQLPVSVKVANDLLKITEQLEKDGINTKEIKENIESATKKISKQLDILLSDQPIIEINDKKYDIGEELSNKLIEEHKIKQIEDKKNDKE